MTDIGTSMELQADGSEIGVWKISTSSDALLKFCRIKRKKNDYVAPKLIVIKLLTLHHSGKSSEKTRNFVGGTAKPGKQTHGHDMKKNLVFVVSFFLTF